MTRRIKNNFLTPAIFIAALLFWAAAPARAQFTAIWNSTETEQTYAVAWGDYDGDGDLDQLVGNYNQTNRVYRNGGGGAISGPFRQSLPRCSNKICYFPIYAIINN